LYRPHFAHNQLWKKKYKNDITKFNSISGRKKIDPIIAKYNELINKYKQKIDNLFILSATTAFAPINNNLIYFNKQVGVSFNSEKYIDIFSVILQNINAYLNFKFKSETSSLIYKNNDFDPIHLSNSCNQLLLKMLPKFINLNKINICKILI